MVEKRGNKCSLGEGNAIKVGFQKNPQSCKDIKGDVMMSYRERQKKQKSLRNIISGEMCPKMFFSSLMTDKEVDKSS